MLNHIPHRFTQVTVSVVSCFLPGFGIELDGVPEPDSPDLEIAAIIEQMLNTPEDIPLQAVIKSVSKFDLLDWEGEQYEALAAAARTALSEINEKGIRSRGVNEVGNAVEVFVREALSAEGFATGIPVTSSGRRKTTGYPDLAAERGGQKFYIEVKIYNPENINTTQRSFYLSPSRDFKVIHSAYHLLIAFAMEPDQSGAYRARTVKWLDLFDLKCRLKYEFNASNRDLYAHDSGLVFFAE